MKIIKLINYLCKNIIFFNNKEELHYQIRIFGIKINIPKYNFYKQKKQNLFYYYKKNNIDITTLPPAEGELRELQLANLTLLQELDYVCKQNNLQYWIDFGTLIGAIRHKGFIPWDDDIDVGMLRDSYDKIIDSFKKSSRNSDIFAEYKHDKTTCFIKVQHKKCPHLFVDIFPYDYYGEKLSAEEQVKKSQRIKDIINELNAENTILGLSQDKSQVLSKIQNTIEQYNLCSHKKEIGGDFVWGLDFHHSWKNWFTNYDDLFPLKTIEFEGHTFPCANNPENILQRVYGNYMSYPKKISSGHSMYRNISQEEKQIIKFLISGIGENND